MKDQQIIEMLQHGDRRKALKKIYTNFPTIQRMITQKGGSQDEAKDIFQESVVILFNKVVDGDFRLTSTINTYLYSVSHNLWMKRIRDVKSKETNLVENIDHREELEEVEMHLEQERKFSLIEKAIHSIGKKCLEILQKYYYQQMSMKEIASSMGYNSDKIAKNQKYKCLEKARSITMEEYQNGKEVLS